MIIFSLISSSIFSNKRVQSIAILIIACNKFHEMSWANHLRFNHCLLQVYYNMFAKNSGFKSGWSLEKYPLGFEREKIIKISFIQPKCVQESSLGTSSLFSQSNFVSFNRLFNLHTLLDTFTLIFEEKQWLIVMILNDISPIREPLRLLHSV